MSCLMWLFGRKPPKQEPEKREYLPEGQNETDFIPKNGENLTKDWSRGVRGESGDEGSLSPRSKERDKKAALEMMEEIPLDGPTSHPYGRPQQQTPYQTQQTPPPTAIDSRITSYDKHPPAYNHNQYPHSQPRQTSPTFQNTPEQDSLPTDSDSDYEAPNSHYAPSTGILDTDILSPPIPATGQLVENPDGETIPILNRRHMSYLQAIVTPAGQQVPEMPALPESYREAVPVVDSEADIIASVGFHAVHPSTSTSEFIFEEESGEETEEPKGLGISINETEELPVEGSPPVSPVVELGSELMRRFGGDRSISSDEESPIDPSSPQEDLETKYQDSTEDIEDSGNYSNHLVGEPDHSAYEDVEVPTSPNSAYDSESLPSYESVISPSYPGYENHSTSTPATVSTPASPPPSYEEHEDLPSYEADEEPPSYEGLDCYRQDTQAYYAANTENQPSPTVLPASTVSIPTPAPEAQKALEEKIRSSPILEAELALMGQHPTPIIVNSPFSKKDTPYQNSFDTPRTPIVLGEARISRTITVRKAKLGIEDDTRADDIADTTARLTGKTPPVIAAGEYEQIEMHSKKGGWRTEKAMPNTPRGPPTPEKDVPHLAKTPRIPLGNRPGSVMERARQLDEKSGGQTPRTPYINFSRTPRLA
ncbi:hypothetical protein BJ508DRAFT_372215 [Ascobolus immersus RN42]|uniref:Uncharacterized protein n=1 Tax=Ascobolus immersus RN42 TaxID=1160509 RepID=A0A3N4INU3_ASCIM|nr:hypothetical protein BJ508DRAFT_372215 [Ascobolus immersus RN42]